MKRNGTTTAGRARWRCKAAGCGASKTRKNDTTAKDFQTFLNWLFSKESQSQMPGAGRTFRRKTKQFWDLWPMAPLIDEVFPVIYVDGIHVGRKAVVLIARNDTHVLGWYIARTENSAAWASLMGRIAPPDVVVADGGAGFAKARKLAWPDTKVQRCLFHIHNNIITRTTRRPRLLAAIELKIIARALLYIKEPSQADAWITQYMSWETKWANFLNETSAYTSGEVAHTHRRLVEAQGIIRRLAKAGTMFTYLDPALTQKLGILPSTTNLIEGATNSPLREMLRLHRGLKLDRRIKAIAWWCYQHTPHPLPATEILATMPTDQDIEEAYQRAYQNNPETIRLATGAPQLWGNAIDWHNMRHTTGYQNYY